MAVEIRVPDMGESVIEATIARWIKQEGEQVAAGEPVVELETDKINLEVGAQQAGVLQRIEKQVGETVNVGDVLALVGEGNLTPPAPSPRSGEGEQEKEGQPAAEQPIDEKLPGGPVPYEGSVEARRGEDTNPTAAVPVAQTPTAPVVATPVAQRMAQDMGIDLARVTASGPGGRITREDVEAYAAAQSKRGQGDGRQETAAPTAQAAPVTQAAPVERAAVTQTPAPSQPRTGAPSQPAAQQPAAPQAAPSGRPQRRVRLSRRRQTIARRLVEAQHTAAMLTTFNEIDMSKVMDLRKRRRDEFKERFGVGLGFMSFFIKASVAALKAFPEVNAEMQGDELVYKQYYDIGIAVGAEEGLVVPIIRDADRMNFAEIEQAVKDLAEKARTGALTLEDLRGGTFTITNGGVYGSLMSTPILNPPQVGILGMHAIKERPVVADGQIVVRPMMYVALSYDHRVVDGSEAVRFLVRVKEMVEDPETLLFG